MPTKKTIDVYKLTELEGTARERAYAKLREWATDYEWWDCELSYYAEQLQALGFDATWKDISFSGFSSQGDGASFTGRLEDFSKLLPELETDHHYQWIELFKDYLTVRLERISHHYSHERTVSVSLEFDCRANSDSPLWAILEELEESIDRWRVDYCYKIYRSLEAQYDYLMGDENIEDMAELNEYRFDSSGRIV